MSDITVCVATEEECNKSCRRKHLKVNPYSQSYANFSLDFMKNNKCSAYIGFGKKFINAKLKVN